MQQAHRDRLHAALRQSGDGLADVRGRERFEFIARRVQPAADLRAQIARHQCGRTLDREIVEVVLGLEIMDEQHAWISGVGMSMKRS